MPKRHSGHYERASAGGEEISAYVPAPLPPANPPVVIEGKLADRLRLAEHAIARLDLASEMVPSLDWFLYGFVRCTRRSKSRPLERRGDAVAGGVKPGQW